MLQVHGSTAIAVVHSSMWLYVQFGNPDLGPHACVAGTLTTEMHGLAVDLFLRLFQSLPGSYHKHTQQQAEEDARGSNWPNLTGIKAWLGNLCLTEASLYEN